MKQTWLLFFAIYHFWTDVAVGSPLYEHLKTAREHAVELEVPLYEVARYTYEATKLESIYDTKLTASFEVATDAAEQISKFSGDARERDRWEIGAQRYFGTGTQLSLTYEHERTKTDFPDPTAPVQMPDGSYVAGTDPSATVRYNPAYARRLAVQIEQPLWRNFWSREVDLQQSLAKAARIEPRYRHGSSGQALQYETESIYWTLAALNQKLGYASKLLEFSKMFSKQMRRRGKLGRADAVDVAASVSTVIQRESLLLNLQIASEQARETLATRLWGAEHQKDPKGLATTTDLQSQELPLPATQVEDAWSIARAQRFDLRMLRALKTVASEKKSLAREQGKPTLNLYGVLRTNGLSEDQAIASQEAQDASQKLTKVVGLNFSWPLANTGAKEQYKAADAEEKALVAQQKTLERNTHRDLRQAYNKLNGAKRQVTLLEKQVASLRKTRNAEKRKLQQARTDQVAVLRYEMEIIAAQLEWTDALANQRQIEADIRFLTHAYPKE